MASKDFTVLIVGGGNCGLSIATGLKKAGIRYCVFERDNEHNFHNTPRDWGMLFHWGADYLHKVLPDSLRARSKEARCNPFLEDDGPASEPVPYINALTGERIASMPMNGVNRVSRTKLRRLLTIDQNLNIRFEKALQRMEANDTGVTLRFKDGTTEHGDVVIGADGSHSKVRAFLVGNEAAQPESVGLTMINFPLSNYTVEEAHLLQTLHPVFKIAAHPERPGNSLLAALDISNQDDPTSWKFQNYIGWWGEPYAKDLADPQTRMNFYRNFVSPFCEPFRTAALKLGPNDVVPIYPGQQWAPNMPWDNVKGRVTLAGDAAHSMVPQRGQGLNNAIKDAADIVDALISAHAGEQTLESAINAYEAEMKPRGSEEVALSLEQAIKARDSSTIHESPLMKIGWKSGAAARKEQEQSQPIESR